MRINSLRTKILLAFLLVCVIFVVGSGMIYYQVTIAQRAADESSLRGSEKDRAMELMTLVGLMASYQSDLIINGSADSIKEYKGKIKGYKVLVGELSKATVDNDEEKKAVAYLQKAADEYLAGFEKIESVFSRRTVMNPEQLVAELKRLDSETDIPKETLYKSLELLTKSMGDDKKEADENENAALNKVKLAAVATPVIAVVFSVLIAFYTANRLTKPIQAMVNITRIAANGDLGVKMDVSSKDEIGILQANFIAMLHNLRSLVQGSAKISEQLAASSEELTASAQQSADASGNIASSIQQVARGSEKQVSAVNETSAIVQEISATMEEVSATASEMAVMSGQTAKAAMEGKTSVDRAVTQMGEVSIGAKQAQAAAEELKTSSAQIGEIVGLISTIAGQTNLLALNAAIEAARAGEQGRGFAVVAEEVRKLAEQSEQAAHQIKTLVGSNHTSIGNVVGAIDLAISKISQGVDLVNVAGTSFAAINAQIGQVTDQVNIIAKAINEAAVGSQRIVTSIKEVETLSRDAAAESQNVSAATQQQSASMEEIAASSQALAKLAQDLQSSVGRFRT